MTTRRLLLFGLLAGVTVLGMLAVWLFWPCSTAITLENVAKIRHGMTLAEVEAILGGPARDETTGPLVPEDDSLDGWGMLRLVIAKPGGRQPLYWKSDHLIMAAYFNGDGRVELHLELATRRRQESLLDMIRRWLRL